MPCSMNFTLCQEHLPFPSGTNYDVRNSSVAACGDRLRYIIEMGNFHLFNIIHEVYISLSFLYVLSILCSSTRMDRISIKPLLAYSR